MRTRADRSPREAFTLIEMTTVIAIIGILMAFILTVSALGLQSARVRATQALITKLNVALEDRLEALLSLPVIPNGTHQWLASINPANLTPAQQAYIPWNLPSEQRAQAIARLDQIKAEFPDVFFLDLNNPHPINFCALPFNPLGVNLPARAPYILPVGNSIPPGYTPGSDPVKDLDPDLDGINNIGPGNYYTGPNMVAVNPEGTGIYGASYSAAAALYRLAGYTTQGCDGVDNNGINGIDDLDEGSKDSNGNPDSGAQAKFTTFLNNHQHKTARAEMLYALLVNGQGPLGSSFEAEAFTANEVMDTDNDGVPEFVDAWGQPLMFFRWPVYHISGLQKGLQAYLSSAEPRQTNPLDPDNQLTALAWWASPAAAGNGEVPMNPKAQFVSNYFISLIEDPAILNSSPAPGAGQLWERSASPANASSQTNYYERAYFSKFLVSSSGPDMVNGYYLLDEATIKVGTLTADQISLLLLTGDSSNASLWPPGTTLGLGSLPCESRAAYYFDPSQGPDPANYDDIDNQNINSRSGGIQ